MKPDPAGVIAVHVLPRSAPGALAALLATRPAQETWALVAEGWLAAPGDDPGIERHAVGGCACCMGAVALHVLLVRLIRGRAHDRIVIVAGDGEHLARTRAAVVDARYAGHLRLAPT